MFERINYYHHFRPECLKINQGSFILNAITFVDENLLGIIFIFLFIFLFVISLVSFFHNRKVINKYKRENNNNDKNFTTKRCLEDGDKNGRHYVYLVNEKENPKTYQWIEDNYTIKRLGYGHASRESNLFSNKEYEIKERIKIYNIIFDIKAILEISKLFK